MEFDDNEVDGNTLTPDVGIWPSIKSNVQTRLKIRASYVQRVGRNGHRLNDGSQTYETVKFVLRDKWWLVCIALGQPLYPVGREHATKPVAVLGLKH